MDPREYRVYMCDDGRRRGDFKGPAGDSDNPVTGMVEKLDIGMAQWSSMGGAFPMQRMIVPWVSIAYIEEVY
jgi:hypothetical protein